MMRRKVPWTPDEVLDQLSRTSAVAADVGASILAWENRQPLVKMSGGNGVKNGTLRFAADTGTGPLPRVLLLYADPDEGHPSLEIHVRTLLSLPPYDRSEAAGDLLADLRGLGIPRLLDERLPGATWPSISLDQLSDGHVERLLTLVDRWIDVIRAQSRMP